MKITTPNSTPKFFPPLGEDLPNKIPSKDNINTLKPCDILHCNSALSFGLFEKIRSRVFLDSILVVTLLVNSDFPSIIFKSYSPNLRIFLFLSLGKP